MEFYPFSLSVCYGAVSILKKYFSTVTTFTNKYVNFPYVPQNAITASQVGIKVFESEFAAIEGVGKDGD